MANSPLSTQVSAVLIAPHHFRKSIRYYELSGDIYGASQTRYNVALTLYQAGRCVDARDYAVAALNGYASYGPAAVKETQETQALIKQIEADVSERKV